MPWIWCVKCTVGNKYNEQLYKMIDTALVKANKRIIYTVKKACKCCWIALICTSIPLNIIGLYWNTQNACQAFSFNINAQPHHLIVTEWAQIPKNYIQEFIGKPSQKSAAHMSKSGIVCSTITYVYNGQVSTYLLPYIVLYFYKNLFLNNSIFLKRKFIYLKNI